MSDDEGTTMEIKFRLDQDGRTARPTPGGADGSEEPTAPPPTTNDRKTMDYNTNVAFISRLLPNNKNNSNSELLDDLLLDCEISDCGLMPRTFWVPANAEPKCRLEQLALAVFRHHVGSGEDAVDFDVTTSGAEWWVQLRPSPEKTGRYAMHDHQDQTDDNTATHGTKDGDVKDMSKTGISFHWDKDEELRLLTDGAVNLHPHLSTVTYLTDWGCPTLVANFRVDSFTGAWVAPTQPEGVVAWPKQGKHLSFDGRFLHAAPPDLMEEGVFEQQCHFDETDHNNNNSLERSESEAKKERRRRRRATFLVNIWLNYRPVQVDPFPETMMDKMSRDAPDMTATSDWGFVRSDKEADPFLRIDPDDIASASDINIVRMTWPMGDCDSHEFIEAEIPLQVIQEAGRRGATVRMEWTTGSCHDNTDEDVVAGAKNVDDSVKKPGIGLYRGKRTADHCNTHVAVTNGTETEDLEHDEDQGLKRKRPSDTED